MAPGSGLLQAAWPPLEAEAAVQPGWWHRLCGLQARAGCAALRPEAAQAVLSGRCALETRHFHWQPSPLSLGFFGMGCGVEPLHGHQKECRHGRGWDTGSGAGAGARCSVPALALAKLA